MSNRICEGCKGSGRNVFNSTGYCKCPRGTAKKAEDDLKMDKYMDSLRKLKR